MSQFQYKALNAKGQAVSGSLQAESRPAAVAALAAQHLSPLELTASDGGPARGLELWKRSQRVSPTHVENFTRELASLLAAGVPLARALNLLRREATDPGPRQLWTTIHDEVVGGRALADALARHEKVFSSVYVAMVRAGEAGGFLDVVLSQIAEFRTREQDLKGKVKAAMVYPCVLGGLAIAVLVFLLIYFIPKFSSMFNEFGAALPTLTRVILAASNVVIHYGLVVLGILIAAVLVVRKLLEQKESQLALEKGMLRIPAFGKVMAHFALVRFCRMLGTLLGSGVPLVASLRVAKEAIGYQTLSMAVAHGIDQVQQGASLSRSLATAGALFPPSVIEMISIAEETGRLDKELQRLSVAYESDLDRHLRMLVALVEPLMLFLMAGLIGTVVVGMLLPIFNLQDLIK